MPNTSRIGPVNDCVYRFMGKFEEKEMMKKRPFAKNIWYNKTTMDYSNPTSFNYVYRGRKKP